ncbi:hypothetical protein JXM67_00750 [candidate division WOR-3 bacterium]|nr:hypothetical protein [candidate division WOR-3 bacterium]
MGTARVEKVLIATHLSERDALMQRLQEEGILHITRIDREEEKKRIEEKGDTDLKQTLAYLNQTTSFLSAYAGKRKGGLFSTKPSLPADEFRRRVEEFDLEKKLDLVSELTGASAGLDAEERNHKTALELLGPWVDLKHPPSDYTNSILTDARFLFISNTEDAQSLRKELDSLDTGLQIVKEENETAYALVIFPRAEEDAVEDILKACGVKTVQLAGFTEPVKNEIRKRLKLLEAIKSERVKLREKASEMSAELSGFETALDLYENEGYLRQEYSKMDESEEAAFIQGWVRIDDRKRLDDTVASFSASEVQTVKPRKDEKIPVALENSGIIKPFEMIMKMYGTPDGIEADPTPFMAPFFALFFALCLTDAGYGLVMTLVTAYLIWVRKMKGNLFWILFYGGIFTIVTGAMTGSWFGNMPDFLQIPWLMQFRDALIWFDPLKNPMPFFYLSLGLGFFQMLFGIGIAVVDGIRTRRYGAALFESLPWLLIFISAAFIAGTLFGILPEAFKGLPLFAAIILIIVSLGVTLVLSNRPGPTPVTSSIILWAAMTAALLAGAKGMGILPIKGIVVKGILVGILTILWLYAVYKGFTEHTLKIPGIVFGVLGLASIGLHIAGLLGAFEGVAFLRGNLLLVIMFLLNLVFALVVLKGWGGRIIWGAYNIYSNTTGVLGIVLSYVRLMALGMVTAGVAAAFNQIAWMFTGIPVVSIILMLVVLIIGHVYNLVMSALSGFVHTLRLQYVEYLPQFFQGGGTPFEPFELKTRYVKVTRRK